MDSVLVYGANWCHDTQHTLQHLNELGVEYRYIDIDHDPPGQQWVVAQNHGKQKTPTLDVKGSVLRVPDDGELDDVLEEKGLLH